MNLPDFNPQALAVRAALAAAALVLVCVAVVAFGSHERTVGADTERATWVAKEDRQRAADKAESARRATAQETSNHETAQKLAAAAADRDHAVAVAGQLRERLAAITKQRGADPAPLPLGEAAGDPIGVLADVLSRADERAGVLAAYADAARIAGQQCERDYDALRSAE